MAALTDETGGQGAASEQSERAGQAKEGNGVKAEASKPASNLPPSPPHWNRKWIGALLIAFALLAARGGPPLFVWQRTNEQQQRSISGLRRVGEAWQMYAQDWDDRPVLTVERRPDGSWLTWTRRLDAYLTPPAMLDNPANPVSDLAGGAHDPQRGFPVATSYALNTRFWNTFSPGPFPIDNLELSGQTVLFVEAGPMSRSALRGPQSVEESKGLATLEYGDMGDRISGLIPYPSTHEGKMAVVAADGHAITLQVEHYTPQNGPHNTLYGRVGGDIYNWNGGHPNGELDTPPLN